MFSSNAMSVALLLSFMATVVKAVPPGSRGNWIDVDTPEDKMTTKSFVDGSVYHLVMSDEFNVPNRTFTDGHDAMWTALDKNDDDYSASGGGSLHFYNSTAVTTTEEGYLKISTTDDKTEWDRYDAVDSQWKHEEKNFKSGMVQGWNKFCFTGGIVEVDINWPGRGDVAGLWPAAWMLGNLGRATYEASTNNIWPWSYNQCDRDLQSAQTFSACNVQNHFGMHEKQGRGATEIDIIEVMPGDPGMLQNTVPPVERPYADMTLQVAPGVKDNRPVNGFQPTRSVKNSHGFPTLVESTWYEGLEKSGNTTINPFFYGTYLAETKPGEPVTRNKKQAFQADAIGVMNQFVDSHFEKMHTFRLEWQPGRGGRIDWFVQGYKVNETFTKVGDGDGKDWYRAFTVLDEVLKKTQGSQIPEEPSYLIFNTAVSTNWGFPAAPKWCKKCFDCKDPKCQCNFGDGFCKMVAAGNATMLIDSVRVYQSFNASAHAGQNHSLGCDLPEFPSREFIKGHEYRYSRSPPFSYNDKGPLKPVQRGGAKCRTVADCGGEERATCGEGIYINKEKKKRWLFSPPTLAKVCKCKKGYTGPHCLSLDHEDEFPSAYLLSRRENVFQDVAAVYVPPFMIVVLVVLVIMFVSVVAVTGRLERKRYEAYTELRETNSQDRASSERPVAVAASPMEGASAPLSGRPVHVGEI